MRTLDDVMCDIASQMRMFELLLKLPPELRPEDHHRYIAEEEGFHNEAFIAAAVLSRMSEIEIPLRFRYAYAAQLFGVFEWRGIELSDIIKDLMGLTLPIDDLKGGRSLSGMRVFYEKQLKLDGFNWEPIEHLGNCRNLIVHADGQDTGIVGKGRLKRMTDACPFITLSSTGRLFLAHKACEYFFDACASFFDAVFAKCGYQIDSCRFSIVEPEEFKRFDSLFPVSRDDDSVPPPPPASPTVD